MPENNSHEICLELRFYGVPQGTDVNTLTRKARIAAANLEEMGAFNQREHEPAHLFYLNGEKANE
jgi:hypothetical protein